MRKLIALFLCVPMIATAGEGWLDRKAEGWAWYEEMPSAEIKKKEEARSTESPSEQMAKVRKELEDALALAVLEPSQENLLQYMQLQQRWVNHSAAFASLWTKLILDHPELSQTAVTPITHYGVQAARQKDIAKRNILLQRLSKSYGLMFIYQGSCPMSQAFARVVEVFCQRYGWQVLPVSIDGITVPEFPNSRKDQGQADRLGIPSVPALFAVEPKSGQVVPLGVGPISLEEIEGNIVIQLAGEE